MPFVNRDATTISFKIYSHYFEAIKRGIKKADIRVLRPEWKNIASHATWIEFINSGTGEVLTREIVSIEIVQEKKTFDLVANLFTDIDFDASMEDGFNKENILVIIKFK